MLDLDLIEVEFECPRCNFFNPATIRQIRLNDVTICRGCKANIFLVDHMGQLGIGRRKILKTSSKLFSKPIRIALTL